MTHYRYDCKGTIYLDCGRMISFRPPGDTPGTFGGVPYATVPNIHDIVIAAAREELSIRSPLESADFATMSDKLHHLVPCDTHVMVPDAPISACRAQEMAVPAERSDLSLVPAHRAQFLSGLDVPQLDLARADADPQERAVVGKVHRGDVGALGRRADLHHPARVRLPDVSVLRERDGDDVLHGPRQQVEVKVVDHSGRIEHALGLRRDLPRPVARHARRRRQGARSSVERTCDLTLFGECRVRCGWRGLVVR